MSLNHIATVGRFLTLYTLKFEMNNDNNKIAQHNRLDKEFKKQIEYEHI